MAATEHIRAAKAQPFPSLATATALRNALEALEHPQEGGRLTDRDTEDARAGIAWWNRLTPTARRHWLDAAGSAVPADAWRTFQAGLALAAEPITVRGE